MPKLYKREEHDFFISADLGQVNDFTAITVIERVMRPPSRPYFEDELLKEYHLRHVERPERGTSYPDVVKRMVEESIALPILTSLSTPEKIQQSDAISFGFFYYAGVKAVTPDLIVIYE